jgi:hypothetical protein
MLGKKPWFSRVFIEKTVGTQRPSAPNQPLPYLCRIIEKSEKKQAVFLRYPVPFCGKTLYNI